MCRANNGSAVMALFMLLSLSPACSGSHPAATISPDDAAGDGSVEQARIDLLTEGCPLPVAKSTEGGRCTTDDGGAIENMTLPFGCEGAPYDGGGSFDPTLFDARDPVVVPDDDCKYDVKLTSACTSTQDMIFLVDVNRRNGGAPATGAAPYFYATLGLVHPAPNAPTVTTEFAPGRYTIGPVRFDAPGRWSLELHAYGECTYGTPGSPHAHATFIVEIPPV